MKILKLDIKSFGKFHNFELTLYSGINIIEGSNEAGKTTISKFIEGVFYGFTKPYTKRTVYTEDYERYRPWDGESYKGSIEIEYKAKTYIIYRDFKNKSFSIFDKEKGNELTDFEGFDKSNLSFPGEYFFAMPVDIFKASQKSDLYEITSYTESSKAISDFLINSNLDDSNKFSAKKAIEKLKKYRSEIGSKNSNNKPLGLLYNEKNRLEEDIISLKSSSSELSDIEEKLENLQAKNQKLNDNKARLEAKNREEEINKLDDVRSYKMGLLKERAELLEEINKLNYISDIDQEDINKLQENKDILNKITKDYKDLYKKKAILEDEYKKSKDQIDFVKDLKKLSEELKKHENKLDKLRKRRNIVLFLLAVILINILFLGNSFLFRLFMGILFSLTIIFVFLFYNFKIKYYLTSKDRKISYINSSLNTSIANSDELEVFIKNYKFEESYKYFEGLEKNLKDIYKDIDELEIYEKNIERENKNIVKEKKNLIEIDVNDYILKLSSLDNLKERLSEKDRELKRINSEYDFTILAYDKREDQIEISDNDIKDLDILNEELENNLVGISKLKERYRNLEENFKLLVEKKEALFDIDKKIEDYNRELEAIGIAEELINKASNNLQDSFIPRINDKLEQMVNFYSKSSNSYKLDENFKVNVFDGKKFHPQENLSSGTISQLSLFIRIAILEELMGEDYIMIFDDAFIQLDYSRYTKTLILLSQIAKTNQLIIFSCHSREKEILDKETIEYKKIGLE